MTEKYEDGTPLSRRSEAKWDLARALKALAEIEAGVETPARVEAAVMAQWSRRSESKAEHASRSRSRKAALVRGAATMAAGVTILAAMALDREWRTVDIALPANTVSPPAPPASPLALPASPPPVRVVAEPGTVPDIARQPGRGEVSGRGTDGLDVQRTQLVLIGAPLAAGEPIRIVRMRVASSSLGELGFRNVTSVDMVDVDVLVGEDGVARGVRMTM